MTIHAPTHRHGYPGSRRGFFALINLSVASLARDLPQHNMAPMRIEDVIGFLVDPLPGDFSFLSFELPDFFLFGALCDGLFMTFQAGSNFGHSGEGLGFKKRVACVTAQPLFQVFLVIEENRLVGS